MELILGIDNQCFLCLETVADSPQGTPGLREMCLKNICRFLQIDTTAVLLKGLQEGNTDASSLLQEDKKYNFLVNLCSPCYSVTEKFSWLIHDLEVVQLRLNYQSGVFHQMLDEVDQRTNITDDKDHHLSADAQVVKHLRWIAKRKCANRHTLTTSTQLPVVKLKKLKPETVQYLMTSSMVSESLGSNCDSDVPSLHSENSSVAWEKACSDADSNWSVDDLPTPTNYPANKMQNVSCTTTMRKNVSRTADKWNLKMNERPSSLTLDIPALSQNDPVTPCPSPQSSSPNGPVSKILNNLSIRENEAEKDVTDKTDLKINERPTNSTLAERALPQADYLTPHRSEQSSPPNDQRGSVSVVTDLLFNYTPVNMECILHDILSTCFPVGSRNKCELCSETVYMRHGKRFHITSKHPDKLLYFAKEFQTLTENFRELCLDTVDEEIKRCTLAHLGASQGKLRKASKLGYICHLCREPSKDRRSLKHHIIMRHSNFLTDSLYRRQEGGMFCAPLSKHLIYKDDHNQPTSSMQPIPVVPRTSSPSTPALSVTTETQHHLYNFSVLPTENTEIASTSGSFQAHHVPLEYVNASENQPNTHQSWFPRFAFMEQIISDMQETNYRKLAGGANYSCGFCGETLKMRVRKCHLTSKHPEKLLSFAKHDPVPEDLFKELCYTAIEQEAEQCNMVSVARSDDTIVSRYRSPFTCHICPKICSDRRYLKQHLVTCHSDTLQEKLERLQIELDNLLASPKKIEACQREENNRVGGSVPQRKWDAYKIICVECNKNVHTKRRLRSHVLRVHPEQIFLSSKPSHRSLSDFADSCRYIFGKETEDYTNQPYRLQEILAKKIKDWEDQKRDEEGYKVEPEHQNFQAAAESENNCQKRMALDGEMSNASESMGVESADYRDLSAGAPSPVVESTVTLEQSNTFGEDDEYIVEHDVDCKSHSNGDLLDCMTAIVRNIGVGVNKF